MPSAVSGPLVIPQVPAAPGTATLAQIRNCVRRGLRDDDGEFITSGDADFYINEGYVDLCTRLRLLKVEFSGTTTSTGTIPFPTDYVELTTIQIGTQSLQEATDAVFDSYRVNSGVPPITFYRMFRTNIETYPVQASKAYTIRYVARPPKLASDTDVFTHLPQELEIRVCRYARAEANFLMGDDAQGQRNMDVYLRGLPDLPRAAHRWGNGPDQLTPQTSYFETDAWE